VSLKFFHILFICFSILLALGFGVWEINGFIESDKVIQLVFGLLSFCVAAGLIIYGVAFLRKLKNIK
jgi:hypothetical protein